MTTEQQPIIPVTIDIKSSNSSERGKLSHSQRVAAGLIALLATGTGGVAWGRHSARTPCETTVPITSNTAHVAKISLPEGKQAFMDVWPIKNGVHIGISNAMFGVIKKQQDILFVTAGSGPEITYAVDSHTNLLVEVDSTQVTTSCAERLLPSR